MESATLDTCGIISLLQKGDPDIGRLLRHSLEGRVRLAVSPRVRDEVQRYKNESVRDQTLSLLSNFPELPAPVPDAADLARVSKILQEAVPGGSPPVGKLEEDALHLWSHIKAGSVYFVTLDGRVLAASPVLQREFSVESLTPKAIADRLDQRVRPFVLPPQEHRSAYVEKYERGRRAETMTLLKPLGQFYPDFDRWLSNTLDQVAGGEARCNLGVVEGRVVGACIAKPKGDSIVKLCTLYVSDEYRRSGLGHHLLQFELWYWAGQRRTQLYVTMPEEIAFELGRFYLEHGFLPRGHSPDRYRKGKVEFVWGKSFTYGQIGSEELLSFLRLHLLPSVGLALPSPSETTQTAAQPFLCNPLVSSLSVEARVEIASCSRSVTTGALPQSDVPQVCVNIEAPGRPLEWSRDLLTIERMLSPAEFTRFLDYGIVVPVYAGWADQLFMYEKEQAGLFAAADRTEVRLLLRAENVYYRSPSRLSYFLPGRLLLFYITDYGIVGEARLLQPSVRLPEIAWAEHGEMGVLTLEEIRAQAAQQGRHRGQVLCVRFGDFRPYRRRLTLEAIRKVVPKFNPQTVYRVGQQQLQTLRREAD